MSDINSSKKNGSATDDSTAPILGAVVFGLAVYGLYKLFSNNDSDRDTLSSRRERDILDRMADEEFRL